MKKIQITSAYAFIMLNVIKNENRIVKFRAYTGESTKDFYEYEKVRFSANEKYQDLYFEIDYDHTLIKYHSCGGKIRSCSPMIHWISDYGHLFYGFYFLGIEPVIIEMVNDYAFRLYHNAEYSKLDLFCKDFRNKRKFAVQKSILLAQLRLSIDIMLHDYGSKMLWFC